MWRKEHRSKAAISKILVFTRVTFNVEVPGLNLFVCCWLKRCPWDRKINLLSLVHFCFWGSVLWYESKASTVNFIMPEKNEVYQLLAALSGLFPL